MASLKSISISLCTSTVCCRMNTFSSVSFSLIKAASHSEDNLAVRSCIPKHTDQAKHMQSLSSASISVNSLMAMACYSTAPTVMCCKHCAVSFETTTQESRTWYLRYLCKLVWLKLHILCMNSCEIRGKLWSMHAGV